MTITATSFGPEADIILHNGTIWRGLEEGTAEAIALWQGRVLATGTFNQLKPYCGDKTEIIDLDGKLATPGLTDAHLHLIYLGVIMDWVDIIPEKAPTLESLLSAVKDRVDQSAPGDWVFARGYDQTKLDVKRHPTCEELDAIAPNNPVMLIRACGHVQVANSLALKHGNIDASTPDPDGGHIEKKDGKLTGFLAENAAAPVWAAVPPLSKEAVVNAIERGGNYLLSEGITAVMDAAVGHQAGFMEMAAYHEAKRTGRLPVRTWLALRATPEHENVVPACEEVGLVPGTGDDMLMVGAIKLFLDGSVGGGTAWMFDPYLGDETNHGIQMIETDELEAIVMDYHKKGYQIVAHAIGDAAIDQLITAYEKALAALPDPDRRHRVEHSGFLAPGQNERMQKAGIIPSPQQVFLYDFGDAYAAMIGGQRVYRSYPQKTWTNMGLKPPAGSDAPVCTPAPWSNLYAMLTRKTGAGTELDPAEKVSIEEALQAYTEFGAYSQKQEHIRGKLMPGYLADIAIFSRNLLEASPEDILKDTRCDMTILGGKVVFDRSKEQ
ncbi:amidohydrolase [uncultured Cohaesibacter sp.]|uniref:amidohydrolase n=1 Tax=uncultured Cohaesibacter sp. TaxID=1002546 RepID=UPI00292EACD5|nr:amidohydrolase [uncultured Cohaesibacter sp.]